MLWSLVLTNLKVKFRHRNFQLILILITGINLLFLPKRDVGYSSLLVDDYTGFYNSAFIGLTSAVLTIIFMSLFGYYMLSGLIVEDYETEVGQVLATTNLSNSDYLLGKFISYFVILEVIDIVVVISSAFVQLLRREDRNLNLWQLILPHLVYVIPWFILLSAMIITLEIIFRDHSVLGNILYFFIWMTIIPVSIEAGVDLMGYTGYESYIRSEFATGGGSSIILGVGDGPPKLFNYPGIQFTYWTILSPLLLIGLTYPILKLGMKRFDRFDRSRSNVIIEKLELWRNNVEKVLQRNQITAEEQLLNKSHDAIFKNSPVKPTTGIALLAVIIFEYKLLMGDVSIKMKSLYLVLLMIAFIGPEVGVFLGIILLLIPVARWSKLGIQEKSNGTEEIFFSTPYLLRRQFLGQWLGGLGFTMVATSPILVNFLMFRPYAIIGWLVSCVFIVGLALVCNMLSNGDKLFSIIYMVLWYIGPANQVFWFDFAFLTGELNVVKFVCYGILTVILTLLSLFLRKLQIENV